MKQIAKRWTSTLTLIALILTAATGALAAVGDHLDSWNLPSSGLIAVDGSGAYAMYGGFFGTIDLGGGPMTSSNFIFGDHYLARFDAQGNHLWSQQFPQAGSGATDLTVAVDPAGNIYLAGRTFNGTLLDYGGGNLAGNAIYLTKFASDGTHQWSSSHGEGWVEDLAADNTHVSITGYTDAGVDFGGGVVGTGGGFDVYVAKLSAAGAHVWSAGFGDGQDQGGMSLALDGAGNTVITGGFLGTVNFGGQDAVATGADLFTASFAPDGSHNWSNAVSGVFAQGAGMSTRCHVATGPAGEVAVVGEMSNGADFGGGTLFSNGSIDAFGVVYEPNGDHRWSANWGSTNSFDAAEAAAFDAAGNLLITGVFRGDTDFGGGILPFSTTDPILGESAIFVALYDPAGAHLFSGGYGQKANSRLCGVDSNGDLLVFGTSSYDIDLGGGLLTESRHFCAKFEGLGGGATAVQDTPFFGGSLSGFPNPFNPMTTITYTIDRAEQASVTVYDPRGRLVAELVPVRWHAAGQHEVRFTPRASGIYLIKMRLGGQEKTLKMVAVK